MAESPASSATDTADKAPPAIQGDRMEAERLAVLDLAWALAARIDQARLRRPAWLALGTGAVLLYLIVAPVRAGRAAIADILVIAFMVAATGLLMYWEWHAARCCRALLAGLPPPRQGRPGSRS